MYLCVYIFRMFFLLSIQPEKELPAGRVGGRRPHRVRGLGPPGKYDVKIPRVRFPNLPPAISDLSPPSSSSRRTGSRSKHSRWATPTRPWCAWARRPTRWTAGPCGPAAAPPSSPSPPTTTSARASTPGAASRRGERRSPQGQPSRGLDVSVHVFLSCRQRRSPDGGEACGGGGEAFVSQLVVDKHVYLSKAGAASVEVWDKRAERMLDHVDCAEILG